MTAYAIQAAQEKMCHSQRLFHRLFHKCLSCEQIFSIFQMNQILQHMGLSYRLFSQNDHTVQQKFRENTNVYAYYIVKMLLLLHYRSTYDWCRQHNGCSPLRFHNSHSNIKDFATLLRSHLQSTKSSHWLHRVNNHGILQALQGTSLSRTLRMTACELAGP